VARDYSWAACFDHSLKLGPPRRQCCGTWLQDQRRFELVNSVVSDGQRPIVVGQPTPNNNAAMRQAIETAGVRLVFDRKGAAGILRQDADPDLSGDAPA
jgi:hypothetical protein